MSNFFEDENGEYLVVVNHEGQHSLVAALQSDSGGLVGGRTTWQPG
jgi:hypothetical protein